VINNDPVTTALARAGHHLRLARQSLDYAKDDAQDAAKMAVKDGQSEQYVAEMLGVNRLTVRKWVGK
jgi:hypothetical protein